MHGWKTEKHTRINRVSHWVERLELIFMLFIIFCALQVSYKEQITFSIGGMDLPRSKSHSLLYFL